VTYLDDGAKSSTVKTILNGQMIGPRSGVLRRHKHSSEESWSKDEEQIKVIYSHLFFMAELSDC
jgi:hypothetical protein